MASHPEDPKVRVDFLDHKSLSTIPMLHGAQNQVPLGCILNQEGIAITPLIHPAWRIPLGQLLNP